MPDITISGMILGSVITAYILYTHMRISVLEMKMKLVPTPEQMAKEIVKIKLPIEELPPELKNAMMAYVSGNNQPQAPQNPIPKKKESYIG